MSDPTQTLSALGLGHIVAEKGFKREGQGAFADPAGNRIAFASPQTLRSFRLVLDGERPGLWRTLQKAAGHACGGKIARDLDARLAAEQQPALASLPLEACLGFLEHHFSSHGWGLLSVDLTHAAEHGLVVARLSYSCFAEADPEGSEFADPLVAGMLQGFFEHISGQTLGCEEIACVRRGSTQCEFVITAPERLATVMPYLGREPAVKVITRLCV